MSTPPPSRRHRKRRLFSNRPSSQRNKMSQYRAEITKFTKQTLGLDVIVNSVCIRSADSGEHREIVVDATPSPAHLTMTQRLVAAMDMFGLSLRQAEGVREVTWKKKLNHIRVRRLNIYLTLVDEPASHQRDPRGRGRKMSKTAKVNKRVTVSTNRWQALIAIY